MWPVFGGVAHQSGPIAFSTEAANLTEPLTPRTCRALRELFTEDLWLRVEQTLASECSAQAIHAPDFAANVMERIWLAVLATSKGDVARLEAAVLLARTDWRDLLVGAGFGSDDTAHVRWADGGAVRDA